MKRIFVILLIATTAWASEVWSVSKWDQYWLERVREAHTLPHWGERNQLLTRFRDEVEKQLKWILADPSRRSTHRRLRRNLLTMKEYLSHFPSPEMKQEDCSRVHHAIIFGFSPQDDEPKTVPRLGQRAMDLLAGICRDPGLSKP